MGLVLSLGLGCSAGDKVDNSSSFGPGPWQLPGTSGDEGDPPPTTSDPSATSSADGSGGATTDPGGTSAPGTSGPPPAGSSDGAPPDSGTFGGDDGGMQPASGWWAHCTSTIGCDAGFSCLTTDAGTDGVCTSACSPAGNAASCGDSPGGTTQAVCLSVGGDSVCALGCEGGLSCPGGMICISESDDLGPIEICI